MKKGFRYIVVLLLILTFSTGGYGLFWLRRYSAPQLFGEAILRVETRENVMALTFDDGPNPPYTDQIVKLLAQYDAHATFFMLGENVKKYPQIFQKVVSHGNEVGNHSWDHPRLVFKSPTFIKGQIAATDSLIQKMGYNGIIYFRAPFGNKLFVLPYLLAKMKRPHILWNIELNDWDEPTPEEMFTRFEKEFIKGSIILLHDGDGTWQYSKRNNGGNRQNTVELVRLILECYSAKGYRFLTISELLMSKEN